MTLKSGAPEIFGELFGETDSPPVGSLPRPGPALPLVGKAGGEGGLALMGDDVGADDAGAAQ